MKWNEISITFIYSCVKIDRDTNISMTTSTPEFRTLLVECRGSFVYNRRSFNQDCSGESPYRVNSAVFTLIIK